MLLEELTNLHGVSGNEDEVRNFILEKIKDRVDVITADAMGNLIAYKKGKKSNFKLMLAAHMDEVGFMVTGHGDLGSIKFKQVGGLDERTLPGQRVLVGEKKIPGFIGIKAIHQQDAEERSKVVGMKKLFIEIGAEKKEDAEKQVKIGEYISFDSKFQEFGDDCYKAKAIDDRVGCAILIELLNGKYDFDLYACFTVQEEVGLRGAEIAGFRVDPDLAIVLEGTTCSDVPDVKKEEQSTILGKGPVLTIMDRTSISDKKLLRYLENCAIDNEIPYQFKQTITGGNDAGKIQRTREGIRVAVVSAPVRYIHSPVSVMKKCDYENMKILMECALKGLDKFYKELPKVEKRNKNDEE